MYMYICTLATVVLYRGSLAFDNAEVICRGGGREDGPTELRFMTDSSMLRKMWCAMMLRGAGWVRGGGGILGGAAHQDVETTVGKTRAPEGDTRRSWRMWVEDGPPDLEN